MPADTPRVAGPDRVQVREALVGVFTHFPYTPELMLAAHRLIHALGLPVNAEAERIADALLSRPAPEGRPDDVRAVVAKLNAKKYPPPLAYDQSIFNAAINEAVDTLLAHLQREAPDATS